MIWIPGECALHLSTRKEGVVESQDGEWVVFCPFGRTWGHGMTVRAGELRPLGYTPDAFEGMLAEVGLL